MSLTLKFRSWSSVLGPELDLFGFYNCLLFFSFLRFFLLLVAKLIVIHHPANGRVGIFGNYHQIKPGFGGDIFRFFG